MDLDSRHVFKFHSIRMHGGLEMYIFINTLVSNIGVFKCTGLFISGETENTRDFT